MELRKIDELVIADHYNLTSDDECYYYHEYTASAGFTYSTANDLVSNFKKSLTKRGLPEYRHKIIAISRVATLFRESLTVPPPDWTLVPIPPSKTKSNPLYDDRMLQALQQYCGEQGDIRELIYSINDREALHSTGNKRNISDLQTNMALDLALCQNLKGNIALFDDVLTTGASFKACKNLINDAFPNIKVIGIFVARRSLLQGAKWEFGLL